MQLITFHSFPFSTQMSIHKPPNTNCGHKYWPNLFSQHLLDWGMFPICCSLKLRGQKINKSNELALNVDSRLSGLVRICWWDVNFGKPAFCVCLCERRSSEARCYKFLLSYLGKRKTINVFVLAYKCLVRDRERDVYAHKHVEFYLITMCKAAKRYLKLTSKLRIYWIWLRYSISWIMKLRVVLPKKVLPIKI